MNDVELKKKILDLINDPGSGIKTLKDPIIFYDKKVKFINDIIVTINTNGSNEIKVKLKDEIGNYFKSLISDHSFDSSRINFFKKSDLEINEKEDSKNLYDSNSISEIEFKNDLKDVNSFIINYIIRDLLNSKLISEIFGEENETSEDSIEDMSDEEIKTEWEKINNDNILDRPNRTKIRKLINDHYSYNGTSYNESTLKRACRLLFEGYQKRFSLKSDSEKIKKILDEVCRISLGINSEEFFFGDSYVMSEESLFEELLKEIKKDPDSDIYDSEGLSKSKYFYLNENEIKSNGFNRFDILRQMNSMNQNMSFNDIKMKKYQEENNDGISLKRGFKFRYGIPIISLSIQLLDRITGKQDENTLVREGVEKRTKFYELLKKKYDIGKIESLKIKKFYPMTKERWMNLFKKKGKKIGKSTMELMTKAKNKFVDELQKMTSVKNL
jgi:hypothetical protein